VASVNVSVSVCPSVVVCESVTEEEDTGPDQVELPSTVWTSLSVTVEPLSEPVKGEASLVMSVVFGSRVDSVRVPARAWSVLFHWR
jgi:hypothetical protein